MYISAKISTPIKQLELAVAYTVKEKFNKKLFSAEQFLTDSLRDLILTSFHSSPEYNSLLNGKLRSELGLDNAAARVENIIQYWANNYIGQFKPITLVGTKLKFDASIQHIESDMQDIAGHTDAIVFSNGKVVPWLEWLLLKGNSILVDDYILSYNLSVQDKQYSRSGDALMRKRIGGSFSISPEFAGNINDNWTTRVVNNIKNQIDLILIKTVEKFI